MEEIVYCQLSDRLTVGSLAERVGVTRSRLSSWLHGTRKIAKDEHQKYVDLLWAAVKEAKARPQPPRPTGPRKVFSQVADWHDREK